jgi:D-glycero-alpha-D-manno-heptose 1-phosphate guanylyltransferase
MAITECIVLAGGLGTRLREAVPDLPKCLAPIAGKPFLEHVIDYWQTQGIRRFIFSLGYKHELIESFLTDRYRTLHYSIVIEAEPLGTGGAIAFAAKQATHNDVLVVNGDTLFRIDLAGFAAFHQNGNFACSLALKPMQDFNRYGVVTLNENNRVSSFQEKKQYATGLINGGVYALSVAALHATGLSGKFSFEQDLLEAYYKTIPIGGWIQEGYFIDIGIPADFEKANREL